MIIITLGRESQAQERVEIRFFDEIHNFESMVGIY